MKCRVWVCIGLVFVSELLAGKAWAQTPTLPGATSSPLLSAKTAPDASAFRPQIEQFVQSHMDQLADTATQKAARDSLIAECTADSSPSYFSIYAKIIDATARKALAKNPPLRVRLNIAVLLNEIGKGTRPSGNSGELEGSVLMLVNDPAEPVVLRALQAAHPVIATLLTSPTKATGDKLIAAILPAMKAHPKSGLIASEAYHALLPDEPVAVAAKSSIYPLVLGPILDLLDYRITLYINTIPDNPAAEIDIPTFIYRSYQYAPIPLQHRAVQSLVNLITVVGTQATNASKADVASMVLTLNYAASALSTNIKSIESAVTPIATLSKSAAGPAVAQKVATLFGLLQPSLPYLKAPPQAIPATTQPATNP